MIYSKCMGELKYLVHGIYDDRTVKILTSEGIDNYIFDFRPTSFNFIQEHVFLDIIKKNSFLSNKIFLHFNHSKDYMIPKLIIDLNSLSINQENIFFIFDSTDHISDFGFKFYVNYFDKIDKKIFDMKNCFGLFVDFKYFDDAFASNLLEKFCNNFMYKYPNLITNNLEINLLGNITDNLFASLFLYLDFTYICLKISSEVEVCYRNIDQNKIKKEISLKRKYLIF